MSAIICRGRMTAKATLFVMSLFFSLLQASSSSCRGRMAAKATLFVMSLFFFLLQASSASANSTANNGTVKLSPEALICIIIGDALAVIVASLVVYCWFRRKYAAKPNKLERGELVGLDGMMKPLKLEVLRRGFCSFSTELLMKMVLDSGKVVVFVKRVKVADEIGKEKMRKFEQHMEVLRRLRHPNVVSLRAYYSCRKEKLLVYDYMPSCTLYSLLHGRRGPGKKQLDWSWRLKIAAGAARGIAFIHNSGGSSLNKLLTHGNIESTNILLDETGNPRISDFGLSVFASPTATEPWCYPAATEEITQESDVYAFGVLLLELLTAVDTCLYSYHGPGGGYERRLDVGCWIRRVVRDEWRSATFDRELIRDDDTDRFENEEEMVRLLQVAKACTSAPRNQRPKMSHVAKMIEEIGDVDVKSFDFLTESPSFSEEEEEEETSDL